MARILIVEDEHDVVFLLRTILERAGHTILAAFNGREALEVLAAQGPVDLIITDLMMPMMGGRDLIARVRQDPATAATPILVLSAYPGEDTEADEVLTKPFQPADILAAAERLARAP